MYAEAVTIHSKDEFSAWETRQKGKEISATFATASQTAKVMATAHGKCLVKMEKALSLLVKDMNRKHVLTEGNVWPESTETIQRFLKRVTSNHLLQGMVTQIQE